MYTAELEKSEELGTISVSDLPLDSYVASVGATHIFMKPCEFVHRKHPKGTEAGQWVECVQFVPHCQEAHRVMWMQLTKEIGNVHAVSMVRIDPKFQGFGLAPKVYEKVIKETDIALATDECQTPGGQYIWSQVLGKRGIEIAAFKSKLLRAPRVLHPVEKSSVVNRIEVCDNYAWGDEGKNDWGFVMFKSKARA